MACLLASGTDIDMSGTILHYRRFCYKYLTYKFPSI